MHYYDSLPIELKEFIDLTNSGSPENETFSPEQYISIYDVYHKYKECKCVTQTIEYFLDIARDKAYKEEQL